MKKFNRCIAKRKQLPNRKSIRNYAKQGRAFEEVEKREWRNSDSSDSLSEEHTLIYPPGQKNGRIDILIDEDGWYSIIEIKSTNWDNMSDKRIRPNVMRHKRQVIRYVFWYWEQGIDTVPGISYPTAPKTSGRRELIEDILEEWSIQCVWVDERSPSNN